MKLNCLQENLSNGLNIVRRAVATRSTLPVLSNVMLSTDNGRMKLSATNLEIGINCWIEAKVEEGGATTVPARPFTDLVSSLSSEHIDMELVEKTETLKLQCQKIKANFKGVSAGEFPIFPEVAKDAIPIEASLFQEMTKRVSIAAARDESRPILTGVLLKFEQGKVTMAAADGFRLSVHSAQLKSLEETGVLIVPATALEEAARLQATGLDLRDNQIIFQGENFNVVSQLIEGNFPDYEQIVPKESTTEITVDTQSLLGACKKAQVFAREASNIVKLVVGAESLTLSAVSAELGDSQDVIPATVIGELLPIALNVKYLIDVLTVIPSQNTILKMNTSTSPVLIQPDDENLDFIHVIMPMHTSQ